MVTRAQGQSKSSNPPWALQGADLGSPRRHLSVALESPGRSVREPKLASGRA